MQRSHFPFPRKSFDVLVFILRLTACALKTHIQVAFCIHNISYQGRFALADFGELNLPSRFKSSFDFLDGYAH
jgi:glycogen synthase